MDFGLKQNKNDFCFSATQEANLSSQSCVYVQPMAAALRNVAVDAALRLRHVSLHCGNAGKRAL